MKTVVSAVKCSSYNREEVCKAVAQVIESSGCFPDVSGKSVLLKPNLVSSSSDCIERAVCTHPEIVYAVGKYVQDHGGIVKIADTPAGRLSSHILRKIYHECGIEDVAEDLGIELQYELPFHEVPHPAGAAIKNFLVIDAARDTDVIISLPKLKTHVLMYYTGAIKNTFGCIPGLHKSIMHRRFQTTFEFANMLVDLNEVVTPDFVIMDAIVGQEGGGPNTGYPRDINYVFASNSVYSLDYMVLQFIGTNPELIPTTKASLIRQKFVPEDIEFRGDSLFPLTDFIMPKEVRSQPDWLPTGKRAIFIDTCLKIFGFQQKPHPVIDLERCTGCGACLRYCQSRAIMISGDKASVQSSSCIRCFGCLELCSVKAIRIEIHLTGFGRVTYPIKQKSLSHPKIILEKCVGCAQCVNICSVQAVTFKNKKAVVNSLKCIRCFCCHEVCNYAAIDITQSVLEPLFKKLERGIS